MALSLGQFWGSPQEIDFIFSLPLSFCCCSVTQSHLTLYDPTGFRRPGVPALHHLPELAQTHIHWVDDATQPFDPLSSLSPPALNLSQHQGLSNESALHIRWPSIGASVSASVLPKYIQDSFPWGLTGLISLQSKGLSRVFSHITVQKHQFFSTQPSLWSNTHVHTWVLEKS